MIEPNTKLPAYAEGMGEILMEAEEAPAEAAALPTGALVRTIEHASDSVFLAFDQAFPPEYPVHRRLGYGKASVIGDPD